MANTSSLMAKKAVVSLREAVQRILKNGQQTASKPNSRRLGMGSRLIFFDWSIHLDRLVQEVWSEEPQGPKETATQLVSSDYGC